MGVKTYSLKRDGETSLSANFKVKEFACKDGSDAILISDELVQLLQKIRDNFGKAVSINSAYRSPAHNAAVGGSTKAQHMLGTAADIWIGGVTPLEVAQYAEYLQPKAGGIGLYQSFTHVDVRSNRTRWNSTSGKEIAVSGFEGYTQTTTNNNQTTTQPWYADDAAWVQKMNIADGTRPADGATRAETWAMLHRLYDAVQAGK